MGVSTHISRVGDEMRRFREQGVRGERKEVRVYLTLEIGNYWYFLVI
jgi:hypothetical protein